MSTSTIITARPRVAEGQPRHRDGPATERPLVPSNTNTRTNMIAIEYDIIEYSNKNNTI